MSWTAKKQIIVARSSAEAEYRALASTSVELMWVSYVLKDIGVYLHKPPFPFCDNLSALFMSVNPVLQTRTKHIEID